MPDLTYKIARRARLALQPFFVDSTGQYARRDWTLADWSNAMCGEAGEAANIVKKIRRGDRDPELSRKLGDELADLSAYIDLLAHHAGIDLDKAIEHKYNQLAQALNSPARLIAGKVVGLAGESNQEEMITVCDSCLRASCWQGVFYCDNYFSAGTIQMTRKELAILGRESHAYFRTDVQLASEGE